MDHPPHWTAKILNGARHGFFGARGGVSAGIYASLNAGPGSKDDPAAIIENRRRIAACFDDAPLISLHQVHSPTAILIDKPFDDPRPEADALVTKTPGLTLTILTADCAPILFFDPEANIIGGAHAGWKGAIGGVIEATIALMETQGAKRQNIRAAIGPCIHQKSYEVGDEFRDLFLTGDSSFTRFFIAGKPGKHHFDLPGFVEARLTESGVSQIETLPFDTYTENQTCFSHRRGVHLNHGDYGRNCAAITL